MPSSGVIQVPKRFPPAQLSKSFIRNYYTNFICLSEFVRFAFHQRLLSLVFTPSPELFPLVWAILSQPSCFTSECFNSISHQRAVERTRISPYAKNLASGPGIRPRKTSPYHNKQNDRQHKNHQFTRSTRPRTRAALVRQSGLRTLSLTRPQPQRH